MKHFFLSLAATDRVLLIVLIAINSTSNLRGRPHTRCRHKQKVLHSSSRRKFGISEKIYTRKFGINELC